MSLGRRRRRGERDNVIWRMSIRMANKASAVGTVMVRILLVWFSIVVRGSIGLGHELLFLGNLLWVKLTMMVRMGVVDMNVLLCVVDMGWVVVELVTRGRLRTGAVAEQFMLLKRVGRQRGQVPSRTHVGLVGQIG